MVGQGLSELKKKQNLSCKVYNLSTQSHRGSYVSNVGTEYKTH